MKCKKCKFWDKDISEVSGYCSLINGDSNVDIDNDKQVYIGYDGYIQTNQYFGCVLYEKGEYKPEDQPILEVESVIEPLENEQKDVIFEKKDDRNGVAYLDPVKR